MIPLKMWLRQPHIVQHGMNGFVLVPAKKDLKKWMKENDEFLDCSLCPFGRWANAPVEEDK